MAEAISELADRTKDTQDTKKGDKPKKEKKEKKDKPPQKPKQGGGQGGAKKDAGLVDTKGITVKKINDLPEWYSQMLVKGQFISYYDVSGCYILEPASYAIWETIKDWFDVKIKTLGVRNC